MSEEIVSYRDYREYFRDNDTLVFTPGGTSMRPMLRSRDTPVVVRRLDPGRKLRKYDVPFYRRDGGTFVLHRIVRVRGGVFDCCGDGQVAVEKGIRRDQVFAVLEGFYRGKRYIDLNKSLIWKVYAVVWVAIRPLRSLWRRTRTRLSRLKRA